MIWAILAFLGVPLWLCVLGILMVFRNNRKLRKRYGDIPARVRRPGKKRWTRGHVVWVSDVFTFRGSPAAWDEALHQVNEVTLRAPDPGEQKKLRHLGEDFAIATLAIGDGESLDVAAKREESSALLEPFHTVTEPT